MSNRTGYLVSANVWAAAAVTLEQLGRPSVVALILAVGWLAKWWTTVRQTRADQEDR